jgi:4-amino-4-deoxy-L-arabinose transferase-like glycosyltransferase
MVLNASSALDNSAETNRWTGRDWLAAGAVLCLALGLRFLVVADELRRVPLEKIRHITGDTPQYLFLGHCIATTGQYVTQESGPYMRYVGLMRTPVYPVFCALFEKCRWSPAGMLWAQALLGGGIALLVFALARQMLGNLWIATTAGLCSALSPGGLETVQLILVDLVLAAIFLAGFFCLCRGIVRQKRGMLLMAALLFAAGALTKPTLVLWPICVPVIWVVLARGYRQPVRVSWVAAFLLVQITGIGAWCLRNYFIEQTPSFSAIDGHNLRMMMVPIVEEWRKSHTYPTPTAVGRNYRRAMAYERELLNSGESPAHVARIMRSESLYVFYKSPGRTLCVYLLDVADQLGLVNPWTRSDGGPVHASLAQRVEAFLDGLTQPIWTAWVCLALALASPWVLLLTPRQLRDDRWRQNSAMVHALLLTYVFVAAMAGTTNSGGPRIMYLVEFASLLLICTSVGGVVRYVVAEPKRWRQAFRRANNLCVKCGYDLRATPNRCPECGTVPDALCKRSR